MTFGTHALPLLATLAWLPASLMASSPAAATRVPADSAPAVKVPAAGLHRFMVVRTFPAGALAGLDAAAKKSVNACNTTHGVWWVYSYANADKTKTFCIYDGPSEQAVRDAATANKIPVDDIIEIPVVLSPK